MDGYTNREITHTETVSSAIRFLLADQRAWRLPFRFERADLLTWEAGRLDLRKMLWMREFLCDLADRVPRHVWT